METNSDGKRLERLEAHVAELSHRVENGPFTPGVPRMVVAADLRAAERELETLRNAEGA